MDADEYRRSADDCYRLAQRAGTNQERESYLEMARTWERLAETRTFRVDADTED